MQKAETEDYLKSKLNVDAFLDDEKYIQQLEAEIKYLKQKNDGYTLD